ncbi:MAG: ammonia-forming cytochrome c nitrite reductase subunit c552 [Betaproteobacteria bacterium]
MIGRNLCRSVVLLAMVILLAAGNLVQAAANDIMLQWQSSAHSKVDTSQDSPATRDSCVSCHTGQGYSQGLSKAAEVGTPQSIGCTTCHDTVPKLRYNGMVKLPNGLQVDGGTGTTCIKCHNSRRDPNDPATMKGMKLAHSSAQADMLFGTGGYEVPGVTYGSSPHGAAKNTCVSCHMAATPKAGQPGAGVVGGHTFRVAANGVENLAACTGCHGELGSFNRRSLGDYDGNGKIEGIQDEVDGLLKTLKAALEDAVFKATGFHTELEEAHSTTEFVKEDKSLVAADLIPDNVRKAAYNYFFVLNDGSKGVHNPVYAIQLLQSSYQLVTGQPVPRARLR